MKITNIEVLAFDLTGQNGLELWRPVLVRVGTDDGITGLGELGMAYGIGAPAGATMIAELAERFVLGADPFDNERIWETMLRRTFWAEGGGPIIFGAMSALDAALWDIKGKALNMPVYRLLGAAEAKPLRAYASQLQFDWDDTVDELADPARYGESAAKALAEGYDCVKVDPCMITADGKRELNMRGLLDPARRNLYRARMEAIRDALGPDVDIIVELHSFTSAPGAVQVARLFEDLDIMLLEEPTHYNSPEAHIWVKEQTPVPLATGERLYTRWGYQPYFEAGSIDVIQPDLGLVGGITEGKKICDLAHIYDVGVQAHVCGSPVATAISLHLEAAIPNFEIHEHHSFALKAGNRELAEPDLQPERGVFTVSDRPGFGVELTAVAEKQAKKVVVR
jgi:L-alanine-DL-glutamate epimerase-like enolase superfamily enzyme